MAIASNTSDACPAQAVGGTVLSALRYALAGLLPALAVVLVARRMARAFDDRLSAGALLAALILVTATAVAIRWPLVRFSPWLPGDTWGARTRLLIGWLGAVAPSLALLAIGVALSGPYSPRWALVCGWLLIATEELAWWGWIYRAELKGLLNPPPVRSADATAPQTVAATEAPLASAAAAPTESAREEEASESESPASDGDPLERAIERELADEGSADAGVDEEAAEGVTQQIVRRVDAQGHESLTGLLRVHFVPGQRVAQAHLGFCPPLTTTPTIEFEQVEGPPARVKLAQVFPYGARFEIKLESPGDDAARIGLDFVAVEPGQ